MALQSMSRLLALLLLGLCLVSLVSVVSAEDGDAIDADAGMSAEDLAAEEAAAAAVGEAAEEEEDDDADALDEDADSARIDPNRHPLSDMPPPADDVLVAHAFTEGLEDSSTEVTLGEKCKAVIAFANSGRGRYHVWGVMGSLNMVNNFDIHVQNFTYGVVNKTVGSGGELSFSYEFTPNERLDTRPFQLALSVFYEAQGSTGNAIRGHSTTFFNTTVGTIPGPQSMSNGVFMFLFVVFLCAGGAAFYVLRATETKKETVEMGTTSSSKNEWLEEHNNMIKTGGGRARSRPAAKK